LENNNQKENKFLGSVKVGAKGQIVIPKEVRDMFNINSGDTLILLADSKKGIAIERYNIFAKIADKILDGKSTELYSNKTEENSLRFAQTIKEAGEIEE
jgi:AbrB family looped-hinge helix DNA binding protein